MNSSTLLVAAKRVKGPETRKRLMLKYHVAKTRENIISCTACPLHETRKHAVPFSGHAPADVALIGEAPGAMEDNTGKPFIGKAGRLLDKALTTAGLERDQIVVFNTVCCRPEGNRDPEAAEINACKPNFDAQLKVSGAWLVIVAGNAALYTTLQMTGITQHRGKPIWQRGRLWFPIKHPAYYLRNRKQVGELVGDFIRVRKILTGAENVRVDLREWPLTIEGTSSQLAEAIRTQGWAFMWSNILEDKIAIVRDEKVKRPQAIRDLPTYTLDELVRVRMLGEAQEMRVKDLLRIHAAKKAFNGVIVQ